MPLPTLPTGTMYRRGGRVVSEFAVYAADRDVHGHTFALVRDGAREDTVIEGDPVPTAAIVVGVSAAAADWRPGDVHQNRDPVVLRTGVGSVMSGVVHARYRRWLGAARAADRRADDER